MPLLYNLLRFVSNFFQSRPCTFHLPTAIHLTVEWHSLSVVGIHLSPKSKKVKSLDNTPCACNVSERTYVNAANL